MGLHDRAFCRDVAANASAALGLGGEREDNKSGNGYGNDALHS